jgi:hypothetical protein
MLLGPFSSSARIITASKLPSETAPTRRQAGRNPAVRPVGLAAEPECTPPARSAIPRLRLGVEVLLRILATMPYVPRRQPSDSGGYANSRAAGERRSV